MLRRVWRLPVRYHLAALALVLVGLTGVVGTHASFSADEGAAIIQARQLARGDGWITPNPVPEVDPDGDAFPLQYSDRGEKGFAPFAKHPLYPVLLAGLDRTGGVSAMVLLSVLGTVAAAGLAGALAGHMASGLVRPSLWVTGIASPLLFDSFLVIAHTLAAALVAAAVLLMLRALRLERALPVAGVAVCLVLATLLRSEALLFGIALAAISAAYALSRKSRFAFAVAVIAGCASMVAARVEHLLARGIVGSALPVNEITNPTVERDPLRGLVTTWLRPSQGGHQLGDLCLFVMIGSLLAAALIVRRRPRDTSGVVLLSVVAGVAALARLVVDTPDAVPGLVMAFPLFWVGLWLLDRRTFTNVTGAVGGATVLLFFLAVAAVQYGRGGSGEWGGRYFALGLPIAVPLVLDGVRSQVAGLEERARTALLGTLVICSLAMSVLAITTLRRDHGASESVVAAVDRVAGRDDPVILTTEPVAPRMAWRTFDRQRWLLVDRDRIGTYADRLRVAGIDRVTFVTRERLRTEGIVNRTYATTDSLGATDGRGWQVLSLRARS